LVEKSLGLVLVSLREGKAAWWSMSLIVMLETCNYFTKCFFFDMNNLTFQGFPVGTKVDEQDPACVPNAKYTLGEFSVS